MYGITETTVHVTYRPITLQDVEHSLGSMIGKPIPDLTIYILDKHLEPVSRSMIGEMYVAGAGVTRGYLNRPELTKEVFIKNPFKEDTNEHLYKTGDLARYNMNGDIEYLGRDDHQVKIRGYRIELNEIESEINKHPLVKENIVTLHKESENHSYLVNYIVSNTEYIEEWYNKELPEQLSAWETTFDTNYEDSQPTNEVIDPTFNTAGWNNSYTGEPIPQYEMKIWLDSIFDRILKLQPKDVLEIGVGTGMLLFGIAPHCHSYVGTDFSQSALDHVARHLNSSIQNSESVQLIKREANDLEDFKKNSYDTIVLNSIIQYFPQLDYFLSVLDSSLSLVKSGGSIFIGDVRSLELLEVFHASVTMYQSDYSMKTSELWDVIQEDIRKEKELVIDTKIFHALEKINSQISDVQIIPKRGRQHNELTKYRYDVVLTIDKTMMEPKDEDSEILNHTDYKTIDKSNVKVEDIKDVLQPGDTPYVLLKEVYNSRLYKEVQAVKYMKEIEPPITLEELNDKINTLDGGIDPEDIWELGHQFGYGTEIDWESNLKEGKMTILFKHHTVPQEKSHLPRLVNYSEDNLHDNLKHYANNPMKSKLNINLGPILKEYLQDSLPDFMIPISYILIDRLPLTVNGKLDKKALPIPALGTLSTSESYTMPDTELERSIADVWESVLGKNKIGIHDDFFELGGHSLLATQLIFQLRDLLKLGIPIRILFEEPTIHGMANAIENIIQTNTLTVYQDLESRDLTHEIQLDAEINPDKHLEDKHIPISNNSVFVTGSTGFLGAYLVNELLKDEKINVCALVRADGEEDGFNRIKENMQRYLLWKDEYNSRIIPVVGDLSKQLFGLSRNEFNHLAKDIDVIYHNGALVNFVYPYNSLKAPNVNGTKEIIRLASYHKIKPIHFISTLYVFPSSSDNHNDINENDTLDKSEGLKMGYTQSKWVAENILFIARKRGIPVSIYRLGRISGDSMTGACQTKDFLWNLIKGCIETGYYPMQQGLMEMSPVDYIAKSIITISNKIEWQNQSFHIFNNHPFEYNQLIDMINEAGYEIKAASYEKWKSLLLNQQEEFGMSVPLVELISEGTFNGSNLQFSNDNFVESLINTNIEIPRISTPYIELMIKYFEHIGYLGSTSSKKKEVDVKG